MIGLLGLLFGSDCTCLSGLLLAVSLEEVVDKLSRVLSSSRFIQPATFLKIDLFKSLLAFPMYLAANSLSGEPARECGCEWESSESLAAEPASSNDAASALLPLMYSLTSKYKSRETVFKLALFLVQ